MNAIRVLAALLLLLPGAASAARGVPSSGFPNWQERMLQVLFNRARAAPTADPKACSNSTVLAPVGYAYNFNRSGRFHASNLKQADCFQHNSPCLLHADISSRYVPNGTCDGAPSCACSNTAACNSACTSTQCTQTFSRISMFGSSGGGEIIAGGQGSPRSAHNAWMNSSGHCAIILGNYGTVGTGWYGNNWVGNFGGGAAPTGTLIAGGHEVGAGFGQFLTTTAQNVEFRVNYYSTGGAPQAATVNVGGTCLDLSLERGGATNATYLATRSLTGPTCFRYRFVFKDAAGATVVLPETGSYGVGAALASCADWDATTPPACGTVNASPTIATAASASPNPVTGTTAQLSVLGADDGGEAALKYSWTSTGPATVTFSPNGTNAAKTATATFTKAGSYAITATVADAAGASVTSAVTVTVSATLTSVVVTPATATVAISQTQQFTASARDQFQAALGTQPAFAWTTSGGGTIGASTGLFTAGTTVGGPHTITATAGGKAGTASVTIGSGAAPTVNTAASATPSPVTGTTTSLSVLGADDGGEASLKYTWTSTGPAAVSFSANGTNAAKSCTATFTRAGSYTLTATIADAGGQTTTSAVTVTVAQTLSSVAVTPASATVGTSQTQQFSATGRDQFGVALTSQPAFAWTVSGGGTIGASSGLFTAGATVGGPHTVTATSGGKSGTATATVSAGAPPTVGTAASAAPNPVTGTTTQLSVLGADDGGEANLQYTWSSTGPAAVSFSANGTNGAKGCTATFSRAGSYTLTATITDRGGQTATSAVAVTVSQTLTSVVVTPATATVGVSQAQQFSASGRDQFGTALATQPAFGWTVSGGGSIGASSGLFTAGTAVGGPHTVTATSGAKAGTASLTVGAGTSPTVTNAASASPATVTSTTAAVSVLGADDGGEQNLTYAWSSSGPAPVTFSANGTNGAKDATATFSRAGSYTLTVTITDSGGQTTTSTVQVTVAQTLTRIEVAPATAAVVVNGTRPFSASARDQFDDLLSAQPTFTWTVSGGGTISAAGLFTAGGAVGGPFTVTAAAGGKSGTATVTVSAGSAPTVATAASASPNPVTGTTTVLSVLGDDDGGEGNLSYLWSASGPATVSFSLNGGNTAKSTTATFSQAGSYTLTVTLSDAGGQTVTSSVTVTVAQTLTRIEVTPATATVVVNGQQQFTATARDQFDGALASQPAVSWTASGGGTVNATGRFTAGATVGGPHTITATSGARTGTAQVSVGTGNPPTVTTAASATPNPATGTTTQLSVVATDDGGAANLKYTWSASGPAAVSFSANGDNAAKTTTATFSAAGTYSFQVAIADAGGLTTTSAVTVVVEAVVTTVQVTPASASVLAGASQQFAATAADQFGAALTPQPQVSWDLTGGGTIDASGLFAAGTDGGGPFSVTATLGSVTGTASVTVIGASVDTTPPTVTLVLPADGQTVSGTIGLMAEASDDVGVVKVDFLDFGVLVGTATVAPYQAPWDTRAVADGVHRLRARAVDQAGNERLSASVAVTVANGPPGRDEEPPRVRIVTPLDGTSLRDEVTVTADASDGVGVIEVAFEIDGLWMTNDTEAPWAATFRLDAVSAGEHALVAIATDLAGNSTRSEPVRVTILEPGEVRGGSFGCASVQGPLMALVGLGVLRLLGRRRRKDA